MRILPLALIALMGIAGTVLATDKYDEAATKALFQRPGKVPFPKDNPYSLDKAELGKKLFFDPRISGSNFISCATCHNPALGWEDGMSTGTGNGMKKLGRSTPTVLNSAFGSIFMWDGRKSDLEDQALGPIQTDAEMSQPLADLEKEMGDIKGYQTLFKMAFPKEESPITTPNIAKAIATYERTIISGISPFDRWISGDENAISEQAKQGFKVFNTTAKCSQCHSGWNFTDDSFRDIGLKSEDLGRGKIANLPNLNNAFKTPGLRDIALRGPYMHDGSIATLKDVVEHYNRGGDAKRETVDAAIQPLHLDKKEVDNLVAFLETLTGENEPVTIPVLPR